MCLLLYKHNSLVDAVSCHSFTFGCPNVSYFSDEIFKCEYISCLFWGWNLYIYIYKILWTNYILSIITHLNEMCVISDQSCTTIGKGCFLAESFCNRYLLNTYCLTTRTWTSEKNPSNAAWLWSCLPSGKRS